MSKTPCGEDTKENISLEQIKLIKYPNLVVVRSAGQPRRAEQLFGLSEPSPREVWDKLKPLVWNIRGNELRSCLENLGENVKCVARPLLENIFRIFAMQGQTMDNNVLRYILQLELPQEEILHFFWRCLTVLWCKTEVLRVVCQSRRDLLDFHLQFKHRSVTNGDGELTGFPLLCVVRSFLPYQEVECERRLRVLLELGANVNLRYRDEPTPIHVAAQCGAWQVVQLLLQYDANVDLVIKGETSRQIIERRRPELVQNVSACLVASSSPLQPLYDALYMKHEAKFIQLLHENVRGINLEVHDGRFTLLQLAIKQKLPRATEELIYYGVDLNCMGGYCVEPILIALKNPKCECLEIVTKFKDKIILRFVYERGVFLHALEKVRTENFTNFSVIIQDLIKEALHQKVNPCAKNLTGNSVLALHGSGKNPLLFYLLLENIGILAIDETAIRKTPPTTMMQFFDQNIKYHEKGLDAQQGLTVCYDFLKLRDGTSGSHAAEMLPFYEMSKSREYSKTVLLHPLVKLFLTYKWRKIAFIYIFNVIIYFLFTITFSAHVYVSTINKFSIDSDGIDVSEHSKIWSISFIFWFLIVTRELFQFLSYTKQYVQNWENLMEIILLITSFLTYVDESTDFVIALAVALTYIEMTLLIGRHPSTGTYITMFFRVTLKSTKLLLIFSCLLLAFAFSFFVCLYRFLGAKEKHNGIWNTILRVSGMAIGELNIDEIKAFSSLTFEILFLAFIVFVTIVLMNLLNALAVSDTQNVIDEAEILCCVANIKHYTRIESVFLGYNPERCSTIERYNGFSFSKKGFLGPKINVLPFQHKWTAWKWEGSSTLRVEIKKKYYFPEPYHFKFQFKLRTLAHYIAYFYNRVLLESNEDSVLDEIVTMKKYPDINDGKLDSNRINKVQHSECDALLKQGKSHQDELREEMNSLRTEFRQFCNDQKSEIAELRSILTSELTKVCEILKADKCKET